VPSVPMPPNAGSSVEQSFIAAARALLLDRCGAGHSFRGATLLAVSRTGATIQIPVSPPADTPGPVRRRQLRELIVEQLAKATRPSRSVALARACGRRYNSHFRTVIADLEANGVVVSAASGYWLAGRSVPEPLAG
jgi:hypothetical protein